MEREVDSNNNATIGKYSLRPRTGPKRVPEDVGLEETNNQRSNRIRRKSSNRSQSLSKYRRKSANARERTRMREINDAFEALRRVVSWGNEQQEEKSTKISTLRLAMRYITALSNLIKESDNFGRVKRLDPGGIFTEQNRRSSECEVTHLSTTTISGPSLSLSEPNLGSCWIQVPQKTTNHPEETKTFLSMSPVYLGPSSNPLLTPSEISFPSSVSSLTVGIHCNSSTNSLQRIRTSTDVLFTTSVPINSPRSSNSEGSVNQHQSTNIIPSHHPDPRPSVSVMQSTLVDHSSPLLPTDMENLSFQPISFEELFIT